MDCCTGVTEQIEMQQRRMGTRGEVNSSLPQCLNLVAEGMTSELGMALLELNSKWSEY